MELFLTVEVNLQLKGLAAILADFTFDCDCALVGAVFEALKVFPAAVKLSRVPVTVASNKSFVFIT